MVIHKRNCRLMVNGGIAFPECKAYAKMLDFGPLYRTTGVDGDVTCKVCLRKMKGRKQC